MKSNKIIKDVEEAAKRVYSELGAGHEEAIYRDAMSVELQDRGYIVKTEMPVEIKYKTSQGKEIIIGSGRVDLYIEKDGKKAILEFKAVGPLKKAKKEEVQLKKYLKSLGAETGILINFCFPPKDEPEIIVSDPLEKSRRDKNKQ
jgi:GxxExxY protein